jgi:hypothetical protein
VEPRYRALRIIGTIYKVLGGVAGVITILVVVSICASSVLGGAAIGSLGRELGGRPGVGSLFTGAIGGLLVSLFAIVYGGAIAVTLYGFGEGIYLLLAVEENTRATAQLLRGQMSPQA